MEDLLGRAKYLLAEARSICVLTGAGVSAESGLATFRDSGGLWEQHRVQDVATPEAFERDPALVWRFYNARRRSGFSAEPNPAHLALARLEKSKKVTILTQNVDGLHSKAGSRHVLELHGSLRRVRCTSCGRKTEDDPVELPILPRCAACRGLLRPDIVWFGEMLDPAVVSAAAEALARCGLFMVVGTSAQVHPAASFAFEAVERGIPVIEVNKEPTPLSRLAAVSLLGKAGELLPKLAG
ncbi:MAG: NAD-dependent deacylase [Elusimicrobia bacterium]|nr:NAD-dependent deacylase [Elusimicrobiota bacterium]